MTAPLQAESGPVQALSLERWMPQEDREAFDRRWTFLLIEELNAVGDRWRFLLEDAGEADPQAVAALEERLGILLDALREDPARNVAFAYQFLAEAVTVPEQAWGAALLIDRFDGDRERVARTLAGLPEVARRAPGQPREESARLRAR